MGIIAPQSAATSHALLGHSTGLTSDTFKKGSRTFKRSNCSWQSPGHSQSCTCSTSTSRWSWKSPDTPGPGRATSHPGFCTLTKQKWLQQGSNDKTAQTETEGNYQEFLNELLLQQNRISISLEKHLFQKHNDCMCYFRIWYCQKSAPTQTQKTGHKNNQ